MRFDRWRVRTAWLLLIVVLFVGASPLVAQTGRSLQPELADDIPLLERPWREDPDKFTFVILGDRTGGSEAEWPVFNRAIDEINLLKPDFVIMVGDLIYGYTEDPADIAQEWENFFEHAGRLGAPFFYLPGNHDIFSKDSYDFWREHHGRTYYSFRYKDNVFIALNTHEQWATNPPGADPFGPEQAAWLLEELDAHQDVRHTFIFMHVPIWDGDNDTWEKVEEALADRPYTVFAGHYHRLQHERRNEARYIVLSQTKGPVVGAPNVSPELGNFPHFTQVVVEDGEPHIAHVEPGSIWREDIASRPFIEAAGRVLEVAPRMPEALGTTNGRAYVKSILDNQLDEPVTVTIVFPELEDHAWTLDEDALPETVSPLDDHRQLPSGPLTSALSRRTPPPIPVGPDTPAYVTTIEPGEKATITWTFNTPEDAVTPAPRIVHLGDYRDYRLFAESDNIPLFPESAMRWPETWMVAGPWRVPSLPINLPGNPREALPFLFEEYGPETGYQEDAVFAMDGATVGWHEQPGMYAYGPGYVNVGEKYGPAFDVLAYAAAAVYSPEARQVYVRFRVDDYGMIFLNGESVEPGLMRTRRDPVWITLELEKGWNTLAVQNAAISGGWNFWLAFADPDDELEFAPAPRN